MTRGGKLSAAQRLAWKYKFQEYDTSGDGKLNEEELSVLLRKGNPTLTEVEVKKLFRTVDTNGDGAVDFEEFVDFLYDLSTPYEPAPADLKERFCEVYGSVIDRPTFLKFCSDAKLFTRLFQASHAEALFDRARSRGQQTITVEAWDKLLSRIAEHRGETPASLHNEVMKAKLKGANNVIVAATRLSILRVPGAEPAMGSRASSRGSSRAASPRPTPPGSSRKHLPTSLGLPPGSFEEAAADEGSWDKVEVTYNNFCKNGPPMSGPEFARLCDEALFLMDKKLKRAECDVIFTTFMSPHKRLDFESFKKAMRAVAHKTENSMRRLQYRVSLVHEPKPVGTLFAEVAHMSDSKTYKRASMKGAAYDIGEEGSWAWVKTCHDAFAAVGGMDMIQFRHLCQDANLFCDSFPQAEADIVFSSIVRQKRVASLEDFQSILREAARRKQLPLAELQLAVGCCSGPRI